MELLLSCHLNISSGNQTWVAGLTQQAVYPVSNLTSLSPLNTKSKLFTLLFRLLSVGLSEGLWLTHPLLLPLGFLTPFYLSLQDTSGL